MLILFVYEEDETETNHYVKKNAPKSKSVHDVVDDPKLSKDTVTIPKNKGNYDDDGHIEENATELCDEPTLEAKTNRIRDKLKKSTNASEHERESTKVPKESTDLKEQSDLDSDSDGFTNELERQRKRKRQKEAYEPNTFEFYL